MYHYENSRQGGSYDSNFLYPKQAKLEIEYHKPVEQYKKGLIILPNLLDIQGYIKLDNVNVKDLITDKNIADYLKDSLEEGFIIL